MPLSGLWRNMRGSEATPQKPAPSMEVPARAANGQPGKPSLGEATPFANVVASPNAEPPSPPKWDLVYPGHYKALVADLAKRGDSIANWQLQDGRDLGVSEAGHTVAFTLLKIGTSATIQVELTMFKGKIARIRVR
jgi:hypothetical protein